jgi:hypothetical protein
VGQSSELLERIKLLGDSYLLHVPDLRHLSKKFLFVVITVDMCSSVVIL